MFRVCSGWGLYFASVKSLKSHKSVCNANRQTIAIADLHKVCPLRVAARRGKEIMCLVQYKENEEFEWHDEEDVKAIGNVPQQSVESGTPVISISNEAQVIWMDDV